MEESREYILRVTEKRKEKDENSKTMESGETIKIIV